MRVLENAKLYLLKPLAIITSLLVFIWILADFSERFLLDKDSKPISNTNFEKIALYPLNINDKQKQNIISLYDIYKAEESNIKSEQTEQGLSVEAQSQQQGVLNQVFSGDKKLQLKAVIANDNKKQPLLKALLLVTDIKTGESNIEQFINNVQVYGYTLIIDKNTQVTLTRNAEHGTQEITLVMYKGRRD